MAAEPAAVVAEPNNDPGGLPENWTEATDPGSGRVYYYNTATNETSWEKPTA